MYIVSACLLGENCRYDGGNNFQKWIEDLKENHTICMVCPETLGKLSVPRDPAEIREGRVINQKGQDLTKSFEEGAKVAYTRAVVASKSIGEDIDGAILKSNSPSCGSNKVYDGTFSGKLVDGEGVFAKILRQHNIKIYTEKENIND